MSFGKAVLLRLVQRDRFEGLVFWPCISAERVSFERIDSSTLDPENESAQPALRSRFPKERSGLCESWVRKTGLCLESTGPT